ncbi:peptidase T [Budviciaceae bacterium BWR-B9]|uniref:Peptidase T n=1 Tax=Limnobaculum allomyrinae TaxID=2791986 RepID=A0ABS1ISF8_9GAMM|nr:MULTISPECIES: peptidase T [Limnobaculum]MBK5144695.1 peptidase T [Limnobaculum allomyrinae]MBV7692358.1 peptidase T [Limnobaculum sp. M2-1]
MDIVERFISYTKINTTTNRENGAAGIMPSSEGQRVLANQVAEELRALGLQDVQVSERAILTATLPANVDYPLPVVAFFGHLDTSAEQTADTHAQILPYSGGDLCLNKQQNIYLRQNEFPELSDYIGDEIIVTDGTSLLGADDKAAIASIVNMIQYLVQHPEIKHGSVKVGLVPDEEQGLRGSKVFDVKSFGADFAYTLDCCGIGELVYENWNAGDAVIVFTGQSAHPMSAKGKLKNSLLMAHKFISMLPGGEAPEYTEGREGYYWVKQLQGNSAKTILNMDVRDFTEQGYQQRMQFLQNLSDNCAALWGEGSVKCTLSDRYANVFNSLQGESAYPIEIATQAYRNLNIEPKVTPMRGGYDGAALSQNGLPCPNVFTGAHNFHSIYEYLPIKSLRAASEVLVEIVKLTEQRFKV